MFTGPLAFPVKNHSYLLYLDAFDTALAGDASQIVERFLRYDCELLVKARYEENIKGRTGKASEYQ